MIADRKPRLSGLQPSVSSWVEHDAMATIMQWLHSKVVRGPGAGHGSRDKIRSTLA
jgi:hypothetical protein